MKQYCLILLTCIITITLNAQTADRWQQAIKYEMDIDFDVSKHQFKGKQKIEYTNNSPDELNHVFYHLYFNAFQPGSMMDVRSRSLPDPDSRVSARIYKLKDNEIGYHKIKSLKHNGKDVDFEVVGTILEVDLDNAIPPGGKATFDMEFESQVPLQIRRSGRDSKEGISYSMSQWYPKLSEYDYQGWHANPYVGREFHGVWGDFDVTINIDRDYIVGAGGVLQNPNEVGKGYQENGATVNTPSGDKLSWHYLSENVHDFMWAADPDYTVMKKQAKNGPMMYFLYQPGERTTDSWQALPDIMDEAFTYMNNNYGKYPYPVYYFIQGGDGGMEYPMGTLIRGERSLSSLVGVSVHELFHSWYQMILGSNESLYPWMDEGFTSYASAITMNYLKSKSLIPGAEAVKNPHIGTYVGYANFHNSGNEEALSTHADHYTTNSAYGVGSYVKGSIFLNQLEYIVGKENFDKGMLQYFDTWKFRHPNPNDFIRVMEKVSDMELDWYKEYWVNTTHTIDYGIKSVDKESRKKVKVVLEKKGVMPMPVDVKVTDKKGRVTTYTIPLRIMRGEKDQDGRLDNDPKIAEDWPWTHPTYELIIPMKKKNVKMIEIDGTGRMADMESGNDQWKN